MALLVTLFLVLVNIFNTVTTNTPKAEGLTAIEAWMLACILFIFGALTEYAYILFCRGRFDRMEHKSAKMPRHHVITSPGTAADYIMDDSGKLTPNTQQPQSGNNGTGENIELLQLPQITTPTPTSTHQLHPFTGPPSNKDEHQCKHKNRLNANKRKHAAIDRGFLMLFPLMFLGFNISYWSLYYIFHPVIPYAQDQNLEPLNEIE